MHFLTILGIFSLASAISITFHFNIGYTHTHEVQCIAINPNVRPLPLFQAHLPCRLPVKVYL
jgi:hypothetical protein